MSETAFQIRREYVQSIYDGSDGDATRQLYATLDTFGPIGSLAANLLRAMKASARAKLYRGGVRGKGSYKQMAYDRKQWAMDNLAKALALHGPGLRIGWGWGVDEKLRAANSPHSDVLYVDVPTGQVSFHTAYRGNGPDYPGRWDGARNIGYLRVVAWTAHLLSRTEPIILIPPEPEPEPVQQEML